MITYPEIVNLYGTPISRVPVPYRKFKPSAIQIVLGVTILSLAVYGAYKIFNSSKEGFKKPIVKTEKISSEDIRT